MMCHKMGRYPIVTIGLGRPSPTSRIRMPRPPQKSTTFIAVIPHWTESWSFRSKDVLPPKIPRSAVGRYLSKLAAISVGGDYPHKLLNFNGLFNVAYFVAEIKVGFLGDLILSRCGLSRCSWSLGGSPDIRGTTP